MNGQLFFWAICLTIIVVLLLVVYYLLMACINKNLAHIDEQLNSPDSSDEDVGYLTGFALWNWWVRISSDSSKAELAEYVAALGLVQLENLLVVYCDENSELYYGVLQYKDWNERCKDDYAKIIGIRIEVLQEAYRKLIPTDEDGLWNWWKARAKDRVDQLLCAHLLSYLSEQQISMITKQLEQQAADDSVCAGQLALIRAF